MIFQILLIAVIVLVPILDQITKAAVMAATAQGEKGIDVIPGVLRWSIVRNSGASMGLWADNLAGRIFFMVASVLGIALIAAVILGFRKRLSVSRPCAVFLAMVAGGGIGNMIDRVFYGDTLFMGEVVDFIDFCAFPRIWHWTFNLADACICVGIFLFFVFAIAEEICRIRNEKKAKAEEETQTEDGK